MLRHVNKELKRQAEESEAFLEKVKTLKKAKGYLSENEKLLLIMEHNLLRISQEERFRAASMRLI